MKKIIIVGHNQENNEKLETLFQHFGMKKALPSRREGLTPIQVGELLSKAIKSQAPQIQEIDEEELPKKLPTHISKRRLKKNLKKQQNTQAASALPKSMWDYIPMDLMIANIDNEFWGWADKNALENLEYWKNLDPSIYFVLTYDQPQSLLHKLESENEEISKEIILEKLDDWNAYNTKMLDFFEKNPERAILINNERVKQQNNSSIKALYSQVVPDFLYKDTEINIIYGNEAENNNSSVSFLLVKNIISSHDEVKNTYARLQENSNLQYQSKMDDELDLSIKAWNDYIHNKKNLKTSLLENEKMSIENNKNKENLKVLNKEKEMILSQIDILHTSLDKINLSNLNLNKMKSDLYEENQKLNNNLNELQNGFEKLSKENKALIISLEKEKSYSKDIENKNRQINDVNKKNKELISEVSNLTKENKNLFEQLSFVQEELEKKYISNKDSINIIWGAAERVKNQLEYRLGAILINNSSNVLGWVKMPFLITSEFFRDKNNKEDNLPRLEEYQDYNDVEKVKNHLSYKLGCILSQSLRNPFLWVTIPFKMVKEIKDFRNKNFKKK